MPWKSFSSMDEIWLCVIWSRFMVLTFEIHAGTWVKFVLFIITTWKLSLKFVENKLSFNDISGSSSTVTMYRWLAFKKISGSVVSPLLWNVTSMRPGRELGIDFEIASTDNCWFPSNFKFWRFCSLAIEDGSRVIYVLWIPRTCNVSEKESKASSGRLVNVTSEISRETNFVRYFMLVGHSWSSRDPKSMKMSDLDNIIITFWSRLGKGLLDNESDMRFWRFVKASGKVVRLLPAMSKKTKEFSLPLKACLSIASISLLSSTNVWSLIPTNAFSEICLNLLPLRNTVQEPLDGVRSGSDARFRCLQSTVGDLVSHWQGGGNGQQRHDKTNGRQKKTNTIWNWFIYLVFLGF